MTAESMSAIEDAIRSHLATLEPDAILTDWFVSFGHMCREPDSPDGIAHGHHYSTSQSSPWGALGVGQLGVAQLHDDLMYPDESDDD